MLDDRLHQTCTDGEGALEIGRAAVRVSAVRGHLLEVVPAREEFSRGGVDDDAQLGAARDAGRVLVTNNICDFVPLHEGWVADGRPHGGIVVFPQQAFSVGEIVRRLAKLVHTLSAEEMRNRLEWLNSWGII